MTHKQGRRLGLVVVVLALVSTIIMAPVQADGPNRAGLVIRHGDGSVVNACVAFDEPEITGLELLRRSGLDVIVEESGILGGAVCKIEGEGCDFPLYDCFCQCTGPDCTYWAYYLLGADGAWEYSAIGAASVKVHDGDVQAWSWGEGDYGLSGTEPPVITFDQVCDSPASGSMGAAGGTTQDGAGGSTSDNTRRARTLNPPDGAGSIPLMRYGPFLVLAVLLAGLGVWAVRRTAA